jgi:NADPH:quinone reductase-like Zn-dependent oxidoreductase
VNILQLIDEPWDSGVTAYALQISELLKNAGHSVTVGVRHGKKPEELAKKKGLSTVVVENLFHVHALLGAQKWDVVNAHTGRTHTWAIVARMLRGWSRRRLPVVRTRGDARPVNVNALTRFIYSRTSAFIAASEHVREQFEEAMGLDESRLQTVYPAVEAASTIASAPSHVIGMLGRIDPVV